MKLVEKEISSKAIRIAIFEEDKEVGRAFIYLIKNELHEGNYGLLEDVYIDENRRGKGYGKLLVEEAIKRSKELGCYKLIATSRFERPKVHELYKKFGFVEHGLEFRLDF